jgi:hypothetical protein
MVRLLMANVLVGFLQLRIDFRLILFHLYQVVPMMFVKRLQQGTLGVKRIARLQTVVSFGEGGDIADESEKHDGEKGEKGMK